MPTYCGTNVLRTPTRLLLLGKQNQCFIFVLVEPKKFLRQAFPFGFIFPYFWHETGRYFFHLTFQITLSADHDEAEGLSVKVTLRSIAGIMHALGGHYQGIFRV